MAMTSGFQAASCTATNTFLRGVVVPIYPGWQGANLSFSPFKIGKIDDTNTGTMGKGFQPYPITPTSSLKKV